MKRTDFRDLDFYRHADYECAYRLKTYKKQTIFAALEGGYHFEIRSLADAFIEGNENGGKPSRMRFNEEMAIRIKGVLYCVLF